MNPNTFSFFPSVMPSNTPTVPPSGFFGTVSDLLTKGLDVYGKITEINALKKGIVVPSSQQQTAIVKTEQAPLPAPTTKTETTFVPQANAQIIPFPLFSGDNSNKDYTTIFLIIGVAIIVLAFIKLK